MSSLHFQKLSQFDRPAEPVTVSIPFARGVLADDRHISIRDGETVLPLQRRVLATWEDGSVKWLLVHFQPDLPGNCDKTLSFSIEEGLTEATPDVSVTVTEMTRGIQIDTGPLSLLVPRKDFLPVCSIMLNGQPWCDDSPFDGFSIKCSSQKLNTVWSPTTKKMRESNACEPMQLTIEEAGPLRAVSIVTGKHRRANGRGYLELQGRITAYAGKSYIEVEHQFIHTEEEAKLSLEEIALKFRPNVTGQPHTALGQGYYRTSIRQDTGPLEMALTTETMLYQSNEHFVDSFYGDFWVDWRDGKAGLTLSIYQAHQNFPKKRCVDGKGIDCWLYPSDVKPALLLQGMAKTHRIQLHFHTWDLPLEECSIRSLQFQLPDRPSLPRTWFRDNNPYREAFFPEKLPGRLITAFNKLHDGRPKALGMLHFGDAPDSGYTDQGRGRGHTVWVNNEYDRPHSCALFYGLTGQRRVLDSALVSARHWLDVDLCHYSADLLKHGGLKIHTRDHVTGGVTPSHEWTEGFLDYYFHTGRQEALDAARSVAENIMRHMARPNMQRPGASSVREGGWALRAMVGTWLGTGEQKWRDEAARIVEMFLKWQDQHGALLAPYTSHTMPRVPFMISLTVNSLARYLLIEDDERVKKLIVETVDDLLEHCLGPDGIFYYKELPSLKTTAPTPHALESLTYAYRITGDEKYLKIAARQFGAMMGSYGGGRTGKKYADDSGAVIVGQGGGRGFASMYTSILIFAGEASKLGLLDWYDYPF